MDTAYSELDDTVYLGSGQPPRNQREAQYLTPQNPHCTLCAFTGGAKMHWPKQVPVRYRPQMD